MQQAMHSSQKIHRLIGKPVPQTHWRTPSHHRKRLIHRYCLAQ